MKNHFLFPWAGNKRTEVYDIVPKFNLEGIDTIIEPFCGTSAISVYLSLLYPLRFKYILNDNDERLIELYKTIRDLNELKYLENEINRIICDKDFGAEMYYKYTSQDNMVSYILARTVYFLRIGMWDKSKGQPRKNPKDYANKAITKFIHNENVELYNKQAIDIIKDNVDNEKCIIYLDPPYLKTPNKFYYKNINNFEDIYTYLSTLKDIKCKIYLSVLFNEQLICKLNNFNILHTYDKSYNWGAQKIKSHILMEYVNN